MLASTAAAQRQFDELGKRHLPPDHDATLAMALADVDGDGDLDLVTGNGSAGERTRLFLNDGRGIFSDVSASRMPVDGDDTYAVALGDVDGDGDLDLVLGNWGQQNRLYVNDGTGTFGDATPSRMPTDNDNTFAVLLEDVDGDGDLDLVTGNWGQDRLYRNDGSGTFVDATATSLPFDIDSTHAIEAGDVDMDGDPDLVLASWQRRNRLYLNDGTGVFTDVTFARMPPDFDLTVALALGDVDGDADLDVIFGNLQQNRLYLNDGSGTFTDATLGRIPGDREPTVALELADVDGDGDSDLVLGNTAGSSGIGEQNRLYLNDGAGTFSDATSARMPPDEDRTAAVAKGDVDGDGDVDLVLGNQRQENRLYLNEGTGCFTDAMAGRLPPNHESSRAVALGDVDGDGDTDFFVGNSGYPSTGLDRLYLNDGRGAFKDVSAQRLPGIAGATFAVVPCDVDLDGDLDLVLGRVPWSGLPRRNRLYLNDGSGTFTDATASRMPLDNDSTLSLAAGDVDGDGDPDLVVGNGGPNLLYLNDGTGTFTDGTASRMPYHSRNTSAVALGDVDADGDLDLILGNTPLRNHLYLNDGTGTFSDVTPSRMPVLNGNTLAMALGDMDGDGDLDVVFGNWGEQNRLYLNDGAGTFTDATAGRMPADTDGTRAVALSDFDGDGGLDLFLGNVGAAASAEQPNRLYENDGTGVFTDVTATRLPGIKDATGAVAAGDVDGDSDPDLVLANLGENRLYFNLLRQLDSPLLVLPGREYRLDVYARYGRPRLVDIALAYVSTGTARISLLPFGTLGLDPRVLIPLPPFVVPQPAGVGSVTDTIPNSPVLVGLSIHAQALLLQWPGSAHLTNVASDRIVR